SSYYVTLVRIPTIVSPSIFSFPSLSLFYLISPPPPISTLFPYTTLFRSSSWPTRVMRRCIAAACIRSGSGRRIRFQNVYMLRRRSEEHTSELQSPCNLVCRLLLEKKKDEQRNHNVYRDSFQPCVLITRRY